MRPLILWPILAIVGDMSILQVKLVHEGLPIKQVIKGLTSHLEEPRAQSQQAPSQPGGDRACK